MNLPPYAPGPRRPARALFGRALLVLLLLTAAMHPGRALTQATRQQPTALPPAGSRDEPLDLNTASAAALRALPGMGDAYVRRILDGRPYTAKNQLVTRGILPQAAYNRIRDLIVAHRQPRP